MIKVKAGGISAGLALVLVGFCISWTQLRNAPWVLNKNEDGIKVYTRTREGSLLKEFKGVMVIESSISKLEAILDHPENYSQWQDNITISNVVSRISDSSCFVQFITELPWPMTNREVVCFMEKKTLANGVLRYEFKGDENFMPPNNDYIRIRSTKGYWEITPQNDTEVKIEQSFFGDPAGSLPTWVINMFIVEGPLKTFKNLKVFSKKQ